MSIQRNDEIDLVSFLSALWRLKYVVIAVTAFFGLAAVYIALTATHIYRADVVIAEVRDNELTGAAGLASQFGGLGRLAGFDLGRNGPGQEAQAVLKSRRLTEEFIKRHDLLGEILPEDAEQRTLWRAVTEFRELVLKIREDTPEGLLTISIEWTDPDVAARWANSYVALANELIRKRALVQAESNIEYLSTQVEKTSVVELERVIYNLIESEIQTLMLANARAEYAFTVVDPAVAPEVRVRPKRKVIVLSGGVLGGFFGMLVVFSINIFTQVREREASVVI